jgi:acyl-CoA thioester hydrolase
MYYGNYPVLYEIGRTETMRSLGKTYRQMEEEGCIMPVASMNLKYLKSAYYDDLLTVRTSINELPTSRIRFYYEIFNEQNELINQGETVLAFVDTARNRPVRAPQWFVDMLKPYIPAV